MLMGKVMMLDEASQPDNHLYLPATLRKNPRTNPQRPQEILLNCGSEYIVLREEDVPCVQQQQQQQQQQQPRPRLQPRSQPSLYPSGGAPVLGGTPLSNQSSDLVVPVSWTPTVLSSRIADVVTQGGKHPKRLEKRKRGPRGSGWERSLMAVDGLKSASEKSSNVESHDLLSPVIGSPPVNEDNGGVDSCYRESERLLALEEVENTRGKWGQYSHLSPREKNRQAQRRFRERQKSRVVGLQKEVYRLHSENVRLRKDVYQSQAEKERLVRLVQSLMERLEAVK